MKFTLLHLEHYFQNRIVRHVLFWTAIIIYFTIGYTRNGNYGIELIRSLCFLPNHMFLVYSFFYFLIPRFLLPKKFVQFFLLACLVYLCSMVFSYLINVYFLGSMGRRTFWSFGASLLGQFTVLGIAISIKLLRSWYQQKQKTMEAQQEKVLAELALLKSQVHPHFLFNTL